MNSPQILSQNKFWVEEECFALSNTIFSEYCPKHTKALVVPLSRMSSSFLWPLIISRDAYLRHAFLRYAFSRYAFLRYAYMRYAFSRYAFSRYVFSRYAFSRYAFLRYAFSRYPFSSYAFSRYAGFFMPFTTPYAFLHFD